jgi:hypothetical protein
LRSSHCHRCSNFGLVFRGPDRAQTFGWDRESFKKWFEKWLHVARLVAVWPKPLESLLYGNKATDMEEIVQVTTREQGLPYPPFQVETDFNNERYKGLEILNNPIYPPVKMNFHDTPQVFGKLRAIFVGGQIVHILNLAPVDFGIYIDSVLPTPLSAMQ